MVRCFGSTPSVVTPWPRAQAPALKVAMPDDQYMDDPKLPEKAWAPGLARTWTPVMTVAMLVPVVVCWGWLV